MVYLYEDCVDWVIINIVLHNMKLQYISSKTVGYSGDDCEQ
jgi:hypothetical protein